MSIAQQNDTAVLSAIAHHDFNQESAREFLQRQWLWRQLTEAELERILERISREFPRLLIGFVVYQSTWIDAPNQGVRLDLVLNAARDVAIRTIVADYDSGPLTEELLQRIRIESRPGWTCDLALKMALAVPFFRESGVLIETAVKLAGWALVRYDNVPSEDHYALIHKIERDLGHLNMIDVYRLLNDGIDQDHSWSNARDWSARERWFSDEEPIGRAVREMIRAQGWAFVNIVRGHGRYGEERMEARVVNGETTIYIHDPSPEERQMRYGNRPIRVGVEVLVRRRPPPTLSPLYHHTDKRETGYKVHLEPVILPRS